METAACKHKSGIEMAYPGNCVIPLIPICKTVIKKEDQPMLRTPAISDTPLGNTMIFTSNIYGGGTLLTYEGLKLTELENNIIAQNINFQYIF